MHVEAGSGPQCRRERAHEVDSDKLNTILLCTCESGRTQQCQLSQDNDVHLGASSAGFKLRQCTVNICMILVASC